MAKNIKVELLAKNIGPHLNTQLSTCIEKRKLGIFAMNGEGKSFLSRALSLAQETVPDYVSPDRLLSFGSNEGKLEFSVYKRNEQERTLSISLRRGAVPVIRNDTGYRFHVFNQEYTKNNLEKCAYSPSDDFEGYVVGKENIDISHEETEVDRLEDLGKGYQNTIEQEMAKTRKELLRLGVRANTAEFLGIKYERVISKEKTDEADTYANLLEQYNKLKALPEGTEDIKLPEFAIDYSCLQEIVDMLETKYSKANFSDAFLEKIRSERAFIESGMQQIDVADLHDCPFCGQKLGDEAKTLIRLYGQYLENEESKVVKKIDKLEKNCESLALTLKSATEDLLRAQNDFDRLKVYFPSYRQKQLTQPPKASQYSDEIMKLVKLLHTKKTDISTQIPDAEKIISVLAGLVELLDSSMAETEKAIDRLNQSKNNVSDEQLSLRRRLCNAKYEELLVACNNEIDAVVQARADLRTANENLKAKQSKKQTQKGELVSKTFSSLLRKFFDDKYEIKFDKNKFTLIFKNHSLTSDAEDVLSDGEKGIVAFCYYLASTHLIVDKEDDYQEVLFVIDDPISSMDFNYVYTLTQILRTIGTFFPVIGSAKMLVLTHSVEFVGILCRNNVLKEMFSLHSGRIVPINGELILPYEAHLKDIYEVATGEKQATHTTGNSLRHVLETLWRFERPDLNSLRDYFDSLSDINENSYLLYTLSNDLSHGAIREEYPVDDATIQNACAAVIGFVNSKYSGQITRIKEQNSG